jgi:peptidoglycan/xylan/chitin deacetylase (PgdA/CDA1 family)
MRFLRHFVTTKGPMHAAERTAEVVRRFTFGARRFDRTMDVLLEDFERTGTRMTFFVTAGYIHRHHQRIRRLRDRGHEIASHGLYHSRMDLLDGRRQLEVLEESHRRLSQAGFHVLGFRAPYLNFDAATGEALQTSPFRWTSLEIVFWNHGTLVSPEVQRLQGLYHFSTADTRLSSPVFRGEVVELPVTAPDDEILIERCRVADAGRIFEVWRQVFDEVTANGELYHLLFHPERYGICRDAVRRLLALAGDRQGSLWRPTLGEAAAWWRRRSGWTATFGAGNVMVEAPAEAWFTGAERWLEGCDGGSWRFRGDVPRVCLGRDATDELARWLQLEGYLVQRTGEAGPGVRLERTALEPGAERQLLAELEAADPPLPRLERWPRPCTAAMAVSADICAIDLRDFVDRAWHF